MSSLVLILLGLHAYGPAFASEPLEPTPVALYAGGALVVPSGTHGAVRVGEGGLMVVLDDYRSLGMRLSFAADPVSAPQGPDAEHPWASILEYRRQMGISHRVDPFVVVAAGFVAADREGESVRNLVLPYSQLALGLRIVLSSSGSPTRFFLAPQTGVVPGVIYREGPFSVVAPVTSIHLGVLIR